MMIPVWVLVLIASTAPLFGVFLWAAFVRDGGGSYDFGLDVCIFSLLAIIFALFVWVVYGFAT